MLPSLQPNKTSGQVLWDSDWGSRGMRNSAGKRLQPSDSAELWGVLEVVLPYVLESVADLIYVLSSQLSKSRLCYVSLLFFLMVTGSRLNHRPPPLPWNSSSVRVVKKTKERATRSCWLFLLKRTLHCWDDGRKRINIAANIHLLLNAYCLLHGCDCEIP